MSCTPLEITVMALSAGTAAGVLTVVLVCLFNARLRRGSAEEPKIVRFMCSCCGELKVSGPTDHNQGRQPLCMGCAEYLSGFQRPTDQRPRR